MSVRGSSCGGVLVVDDDEGFRAIVMELLEGFGYEVLAAENGVEALDLLRGGLRPCVILLDLMMPKMNGWEFLESRRHEPALAQIPVAVLSGVDDLRTKAASLGVNASLRKPVDLDTLLGVIERHC